MRMSYQTANLIMAISFGVLEISLPIYLLMRIKKLNEDQKSKEASTYLGGIFPSLLIYFLSMSQALIVGEKVIETGVIMLFMVGGFQLVGFLISVPVSIYTRNLKKYQAFFAGSIAPFLLWLGVFYAMWASGI